MIKKLLIILPILVLAVALVISASGSNDDQGAVAGTGVDRFVNYSETALADTKGSDRVLFFHASWCSVCKEFESQIKDQGVPEGVNIIKADYDRDTELRQRYNVNVQSTFVLLDDNDEIVQAWPFGRGLSDISDLYQQI